MASYIDRGNIGNAKAAGMNDEIGITSDDYAWLITIYYIAYIAFHWVSKYALRSGLKVRTLLTIPICRLFSSGKLLIFRSGLPHSASVLAVPASSKLLATTGVDSWLLVSSLVYLRPASPPVSPCS